MEVYESSGLEFFVSEEGGVICPVPLFVMRSVFFDLPSNGATTVKFFPLVPPIGSIIKVYAERNAEWLVPLGLCMIFKCDAEIFFC